MVRVMAMNFDFNQIRAVIRGEVNGSVRFLVSFFCAAGVWLAVNWLSGLSASASSTLALQQERYAALSSLAAEYKTLAPVSAARGDVNAIVIFNEVSGQLNLGVRVGKINPAPDGKRFSVDIGRLYSEELTDIVRELSARGVRVISATIRALPAGSERLFSLEAEFEVIPI
ncbi:MAG: hypothetical protein LBO82_02165 [Synergistaceae bacterium]|jgi:hypothetical protein|nr:hypothetical protein [Synergistaceae bacterium]